MASLLKLWKARLDSPELKMNWGPTKKDKAFLFQNFQQVPLPITLHLQRHTTPFDF